MIHKGEDPMGMEYILGLDVGGTKTAAVIGDTDGSVHLRHEIPTDAAQGFADTFERICVAAGSVLGSAKKQGLNVAWVSVSIGGPLDIEKGIIFSPPNLPGWDEVPLKRLLEKRLGLPCFVEHDGNAGALAEWHFGAGRGYRNVVFLTLGTGLGGGLILDGCLYRGTTDMAGEVGHIRLAKDGPMGYGKSGSWEGFCAGSGITKLATWLFPARWPEGSITLPELANSARGGDEDAIAVLHASGERLGQGLAMIIDLLNPEVIVMGPLAIRLGEFILAPARETIRREALAKSAEACKLKPSELGERLGDVAALCAAITAMRRESAIRDSHQQR